MKYTASTTCHHDIATLAESLEAQDIKLLTIRDTNEVKVGKGYYGPEIGGVWILYRDNFKDWTEEEEAFIRSQFPTTDLNLVRIEGRDSDGDRDYRPSIVVSPR